jgi:lipopolysaccharide transport system ATP-binding protein
MAAVENLCDRGLVLKGGQVQFLGGHSEAIREYLRAGTEATVSVRERTDREGSGKARVVGIDIRDAEGNPLDVVTSGTDIQIGLRYELADGFMPANVNASVQVRTKYDTPVFLQHNRMTADPFRMLPQKGEFICHIERLPLTPSSYRIDCSLMDGDQFLDNLTDVADLTVVDGDYYGSGEVPPDTHGCCLVDARWTLEPTH